MSPLPAQASAPIGGRDVDIVASVLRRPGDEGVLYATGTENSGVSLFVQRDRLVLDYNAFDDHVVIESSQSVPEGACELELRLRKGPATGGWATLVIDGEECGRAELPLYLRIISSVGASVGRDHGSAVSPRYEAPFEFSGVLHEVVISLLDGLAADGTRVVEARTEMGRQ